MRGNQRPSTAAQRISHRHFYLHAPARPGWDYDNYWSAGITWLC